MIVANCRIGDRGSHEVLPADVRVSCRGRFLDPAVTDSSAQPGKTPRADPGRGRFLDPACHPERCMQQHWVTRFSHKLPHGETDRSKIADSQNALLQQQRKDTLPEWSEGVDSSSTSASCVGSDPTGVIVRSSGFRADSMHQAPRDILLLSVPCAGEEKK